MSERRYYSLDAMKAIAAFLVICIHMPFPGEAGKIIVALARIAVPFFFMVSGFFMGTNLKSIKKSIFNIVKLTFLANALYFIWNYLLSIISTGSFVSYLKLTFTTNNIINLLLLNESPIAGHLWYLNAYIYVLVIYYITVKYGIVTKLYWLIPVLLFGDLMFGTYSKVLFNVEVPYLLVRNFIFVGLPYYWTGNFLYRHKKRILDKKMSNNKSLTFFIVLFTITTLLEKYFLNYFNLIALREHYLSTTLLVVSIFLILIKNNNLFFRIKLSDIGRKYSTYIYIIHMLVISVYSITIKTLGIAFLDKIAPLIVMAISVVLSSLYLELKIRYVMKDN